MSLIDNEAMQYILGNRPDLAQKMVSKDVFGLTKMIPGVGNKAAAKVGRFAGRVAPALSAFQNVADVADIVTGEENLANKSMDVAARGLGGAAGFALGGPLGASIGASFGKTLSDGTQFLLGGGKSPEERKLEEALLALQRGGLV